MKHLKEFNLNMEKIYIFIMNLLYKYKAQTHYIYIFCITPKIILPIILLIDIFYLNIIRLFYLSLISLLLPLIYKYVYSCLHRFYIQQIECIEKILHIRIKDFSKGISDFGDYASHFYIQEITMNRLNIRTTSTTFNIILRDNYIKKNLGNRSSLQLEAFYKNFCHKSFSSCSKLYEIIYYYTMQEKNINIYINIYMLSIYFLCWSYVLITADYSKIDVSILMILNNVIEKEPFSETKL